MIPRFDRNAALALAALLVPILLYLPTLGYGFVFDDRPLLIENPVVQSPQGIGEIFTTDLDPKARLQEAPTTNYLRPLFLAVAAGLYRLAGAEPFGWHLAAILLHGLLGWLAFRLLRGEGLGGDAALFAALLFSLHPAHVQSAAWVSGIQDLLFALLALVAYLAYRASSRQARPRGALAALGLSYAVALLAKEPAVGLLIFVLAEGLLAELASRRGAIPRGPDTEPGRRPWAELGVLAAVTGAYFAYRAAVLGTLAHRFPTAPPWPEAIASVPVALLAYLRDLLFPADLFLLHPARPVDSWLAPPALFSLLLVAAVAALAVWGASRRPALVRPLLFLAAWLAPVLALWAVNPEWMVMDRYLLLPSLALGWLLAELAAGQGSRRLRVAAGSVAIVVFAALSWRAMGDFRDEDSFWNAAVEADPGSSTAWTEWARRRAEAGDPAAAEAALEKAIALDQQAQLPRLRRALLALRGGRAAAAVAELETLVERNPGYLPAWRNLPVAYSQAGDGAGAWRSLERGLALFPADPLLWTHRAVVLRSQGRREEALAAIRRASELGPGDPALALREALLLAELGRPEDAAAAARRGLELRPSAALRGQLEALAAR